MGKGIIFQNPNIYLSSNDLSWSMSRGGLEPIGAIGDQAGVHNRWEASPKQGTYLDTRTLLIGRRNSILTLLAVAMCQAAYGLREEDHNQPVAGQCSCVSIGFFPQCRIITSKWRGGLQYHRTLKISVIAMLNSHLPTATQQVVVGWVSKWLNRKKTNASQSQFTFNVHT